MFLIVFIQRKGFNMIIFAQIIAIFAIIAYSFAPHQKTKKKVLTFKIVSNSLYTLQYVLLGAMSAAGTKFLFYGE